MVLVWTSERERWVYDLCSVRLLTCVSATDRGMIDKVNAVVETSSLKDEDCYVQA